MKKKTKNLFFATGVLIEIYFNFNLITFSSSNAHFFKKRQNTKEQTKVVSVCVCVVEDG